MSRGRRRGGGSVTSRRGPWLSVIEREAGRHVGPHSHDQDEIVFIMEGGFTLEGDDHFCGPGTILSFPRNIKYGFTVGDGGVKWLMVRSGTLPGEAKADWEPSEPMTFAKYREKVGRPLGGS